MWIEKLSWISASVLCLLLFGYAGFFIGYKLTEIKQMIKNHKHIETVKPGVTPTDRRFTNENMINQESSGVVEPKEPGLIEWEEEQALMKKAGENHA